MLRCATGPRTIKLVAGITHQTGMTLTSTSASRVASVVFPSFSSAFARLYRSRWLSGASAMAAV